MEATPITPAGTVRSPTHPLLLVAAASVTVLSLAGVASLAGWLPGPGARGVEPAKVASVAPAAPAAPATPAVPAAEPKSIEQAVKLPPEKAKAVAKPSERAPVAVRHAPPAPAPIAAAAPAPAPVYSAPPAPPSASAVAAPPPAICRECGVVETVTEVPVQAKASGGGAVAGGIIGGIVGNQIGKGTTRDIATVLGAVGGAYAGNHIEKSSKESKRYDVVVRFEDGSTRTFSSDSPPAWHIGDRVRLQNGGLTAGGSRSVGSSGVI